MLKIKKHFAKDGALRKVTINISGNRSLATISVLIEYIADAVAEFIDDMEVCKCYQQNPEEFSEQLDVQKYLKALQVGLFDNSKKEVKIN